MNAGKTKSLHALVEIRDLISRLRPDLAEEAHDERRASQRFHFRKSITAWELAADRTPIGAPLLMTSKNISEFGIGLVAWNPIKSRLLLLQIPGINEVPIRVHANVKRCVSMDHFQSRFQVGCQFLIEFE